MMKMEKFSRLQIALNVIAIGGVDDENNIENGIIKTYHSSYGATVDDLMKPELVVHAMWIAAPIYRQQKNVKKLKYCITFLIQTTMSLIKN